MEKSTQVEEKKKNKQTHRLCWIPETKWENVSCWSHRFSYLTLSDSDTQSVYITVFEVFLIHIGVGHHWLAKHSTSSHSALMMKNLCAFWMYIQWWVVTYRMWFGTFIRRSVSADPCTHNHFSVFCWVLWRFLPPSLEKGHITVVPVHILPVLHPGLSCRDRWKRQPGRKRSCLEINS